MEQVATAGEVRKTTEVQSNEAIVRLKNVEGAYEAEASGVPKEFVSESATKLASEKVQATSNVVETNMTGNNLNYIFEDCFDSSTLNHISPTPSLKPYPKHTPLNVHNSVQQSKPVMDSPNPTLII